MKKVVDWINSHKIITVCIALFLFVVQPIVVHLMFKTPAATPYWENTWDAGDLLGYIAGFEAFIGTVFLGVVAARQNEKANNINNRMLDDQHLRDIYQRRPILHLINVECEIVQRDIAFRERINNYAQQDLKTDDFNNVCIMRVELQNVSTNIIDAELQQLTIKILASGSNLIYVKGGPPINSNTNIHSIQKDSKYPLNFILSSEILETNPNREAILTIKLRNIIGEISIETIKFILVGEKRIHFYQPDYDFQP